MSAKRAARKTPKQISAETSATIESQGKRVCLDACHAKFHDKLPKIEEIER